MNNDTTKMSQPENSWKKPWALSGFQYCTRRPVPTIRKPLAMTAMGMAAMARSTRMRTRFSSRYPYMIASVVSVIRERIPLQASATSKGIAGRLMMLPSRNTGTPRKGKNHAETLDARICKGKVIWLNTMAGMGIIKTSNAKGNSSARKNSQPRKKITRPVVSRTSEKRDRNNSAPKTPRIRVHKERRIKARPQFDGVRRIDCSFCRSCQTTNKEKMGTKNPWEKFGSERHWNERRSRMGA